MRDACLKFSFLVLQCYLITSITTSITPPLCNSELYRFFFILIITIIIFACFTELLTFITSPRLLYILISFIELIWIIFAPLRVSFPLFKKIISVKLSPFFTYRFIFIRLLMYVSTLALTL